MGCAVRFQIAFMLFCHCFVVYMIRVNMSVNVLAMRKDSIEKVEGHNHSGVVSVKPNTAYGHYNWTPHQEMLLLGAYYMGYVTVSLIGGIVCDRFGARIIGGIGLAGNTVVSFITPICFGAHFWVGFSCRILNGILTAIAFPGNQSLIAKWAPPNERAIFVSTMTGSSIGTLVSWILCAYLAEHVGWDWSFYGTGIISAVVTILWFIIVFDDPSKHWYIGEEEVNYILESTKGLIIRARQWAPFIYVISSIPFYALIVCHYGHMWNLYFQLTMAPKYFYQVQKFRLLKAATYSGLPFFVRSITAFGFATAADAIRKYTLLPLTFTRKLFIVFSHIIPGFSFFFFAAFCENPTIGVVILCIGMGFNAGAVATNLINVQDLAPNFAATLYGIMNLFANTAGFLAPIITMEVVENQNSISEWKIVFVINAFMYLIPGILFVIFGSGEVQPWNNPRRYDDE